jgi:hypothetical protein
VACLWVVESLRIPRHACELLEKVWTLLFVKKILCLVYLVNLANNMSLSAFFDKLDSFDRNC